jgi:hypothetical protein
MKIESEHLEAVAETWRSKAQGRFGVPQDHRLRRCGERENDDCHLCFLLPPARMPPKKINHGDLVLRQLKIHD